MFRKKVSEVARKELKPTETTWEVIKEYGNEKCRSSKVKIIYGYDKLLNMPMQESYNYKGYQNEKKGSIDTINPFEEAVIIQDTGRLIRIFYYIPSILMEALHFEQYYKLKNHLQSNWELYNVYRIELGELHPVDSPENLYIAQEIICISKQKLEYLKGIKTTPVSMIMTYF